MAGEVYLGVDGGASGTRALLIDAAGTVLGYGTGGNANHQGIGYDVAVAHVAAAVREAGGAAGIEPTEIAFAHFALAGDDVPDDEVRLRAGLEQAFPGLAPALSNDVWAGLRAGSATGYGVAVNCGSGCGAVGRDPAGRGVIIPDLGYRFGDSGGGHQIGVDAFRAVIRAWDGRGEPTSLTASLLELTGQPDERALYLAMYRDEDGEEMERAERAATKLVFTAAAAGDTVAIAILARIGDELGVSGAAIARRLDLGGMAFSFVLTGGAFRTLRSPLAQAAIARMRTVAPECRPTLPLLQPVGGAALLALDTAGRVVSETHYTALREQGYGWHPESL